MLPRMSGFSILPAIRVLKTSPMPRLKRISAGARESMQLSSTAAGNCPEAVALCSARKSLGIFRPSRKRVLPSFNFAMIESGVIWSRASFVSATIDGSGGAAGISACFVSSAFELQAESKPIVAAAVDVVTNARLDGRRSRILFSDSIMGQSLLVRLQSGSGIRNLRQFQASQVWSNLRPKGTRRIPLPQGTSDLAINLAIGSSAYDWPFLDLRSKRN